MKTADILGRGSALRLCQIQIALPDKVRWQPMVGKSRRDVDGSHIVEPESAQAFGLLLAEGLPRLSAGSGHKFRGLIKAKVRCRAKVEVRGWRLSGGEIPPGPCGVLLFTGK